VELQIAPEATDRFFGNNKDLVDVQQEDNHVRACEQKVEMVSRYIRAKNVLGKWLYIAQESDRRQFIKVCK